MTQPMEPLGDWLDIAPWKSLTLLLIDPHTFTQACRITDKRAILSDAHAILIAVWPGEWSTSARYFEFGDHAKVLDVLR